MSDQEGRRAPRPWEEALPPAPRPRRRVDLPLGREAPKRAHPLARAAKIHSRAPRPTGRLLLRGPTCDEAPTFITEEAALLLLAAR